MILVCSGCGQQVSDDLPVRPPCRACGSALVRRIEWPKDAKDVKAWAAHYSILADQSERDIAALTQALRDAEALARRWFVKSKDSGISEDTAVRAEILGEMQARIAALESSRAQLKDEAFRWHIRASLAETVAAECRRHLRFCMERIGPAAVLCEECRNPKFACRCDGDGL